MSERTTTRFTLRLVPRGPLAPRASHSADRDAFVRFRYIGAERERENNNNVRAKRDAAQRAETDNCRDSCSYAGRFRSASVVRNRACIVALSNGPGPSSPSPRRRPTRAIFNRIPLRL